ncbi:hypothetical protein DFH08DRAFT_826531 [Mycena albidolilacea]|uniref:Uncharacterized protein n=1 Tax=Mycena albidolilacea TaxID=1033008 RepID=A0AAD6Z0H2_9AGAR|nr:hypothetical protein DFH08DRAFT_826531 [Mycena albidolilacea]
MKDVQTKIQSYVHKYRQARTAMITLGCNPQDPKFGIPELRDKDLYTKNVDQPHNLGDGGKLEGWIWQQSYHENLSEAEEAEYYEYNGTMLMLIWKDGKKKLKSLHKSSTIQFKDSTKWRPSGLLLLMTIEKIQERRLYALKKANMYQEMGKDAQEKFAKVGGTWPRAGVGLAQHIKSEHPDQKIDWDASIVEEN